MSLLVGLIALLIGFLAIRIAASRFAAAQRRAGRWDDRGPLVETEGPTYRYRNSSMDERREVVGEWTPRVVRDRRHEASGHRQTPGPDTGANG